MALNFAHESHRKDYICVCSSLILFAFCCFVCIIDIGCDCFHAESSIARVNEASSHMDSLLSAHNKHVRIYKCTNPHIYHALKYTWQKRAECKLMENKGKNHHPRSKSKRKDYAVLCLKYCITFLFLLLLISRT